MPGPPVVSESGEGKVDPGAVGSFTVPDLDWLLLLGLCFQLRGLFLLLLLLIILQFFTLHLRFPLSLIQVHLVLFFLLILGPLLALILVVSGAFENTPRPESPGEGRSERDFVRFRLTRKRTGNLRQS